MDQFPEDMPEELKKILMEIMEKHGLSMDDILAVVMAKGPAGAAASIAQMAEAPAPNPGDPFVRWDDPVKRKKTIGQTSNLMNILHRAKELGLDVPETINNRLMAAALVCATAMCLSINLDTVDGTNSINIKSIKFSVNGTEEAKAFGKLLKKAQKKIENQPDGRACMDIAANWILSRS